MTGRLVGLFDTSRSITAALTVDEVVRALYEEVERLLPEDEASAIIWTCDDAGEPAPYGMLDGQVAPRLPFNHGFEFCHPYGADDVISPTLNPCA